MALSEVLLQVPNVVLGGQGELSRIIIHRVHVVVHDLCLDIGLALFGDRFAEGHDRVVDHDQVLVVRQLERDGAGLGCL